MKSRFRVIQYYQSHVIIDNKVSNYLSINSLALASINSTTNLIAILPYVKLIRNVHN